MILVPGRSMMRLSLRGASILLAAVDGDMRRQATALAPHQQSNGRPWCSFTHKPPCWYSCPSPLASTTTSPKTWEKRQYLLIATWLIFYGWWDIRFVPGSQAEH